MNNKTYFINWLSNNKDKKLINFSDIETDINKFVENLNALEFNENDFFTLQLKKNNLFLNKLYNCTYFDELIEQYPITNEIIKLYTNFISTLTINEELNPTQGSVINICEDRTEDVSFINFLSKSESLYIINENKQIEKKTSSTQGSYNISKIILNYGKNQGFFIQANIPNYMRPLEEIPYSLSPDYKFELGPGIKWLIDETEKEVSYKFIISTNISNNKPQIYRASYKNLYQIDNSKEYLWFILLYNRNLPCYNLIFTFSFTQKKLLLDIILK